MTIEIIMLSGLAISAFSAFISHNSNPIVGRNKNKTEKTKLTDAYLLNLDHPTENNKRYLESLFKLTTDCNKNFNEVMIVMSNPNKYRYIDNYSKISRALEIDTNGFLSINIAWMHSNLAEFTIHLALYGVSCILLLLAVLGHIDISYWTLTLFNLETWKIGSRGSDLLLIFITLTMMLISMYKLYSIKVPLSLIDDYLNGSPYLLQNVFTNLPSRFAIGFKFIKWRAKSQTEFFNVILAIYLVSLILKSFVESVS